MTLFISPVIGNDILGYALGYTIFCVRFKHKDEFALLSFTESKNSYLG